MFEVTIKGAQGSKIANIKAFRQFSGASLTDSKAIIEAAETALGTRVRMTPEQFANFEFEYRYRKFDDPLQFEWWIADVVRVDDVSNYFVLTPRPEFY